MSTSKQHNSFFTETDAHIATQNTPVTPTLKTYLTRGLPVLFGVGVLYTPHTLGLSTLTSLITFIAYGAFLYAIWIISRLKSERKTNTTSLTLLKHLLDNTPTAQLITDAQNKTLYRNAAFLDLFDDKPLLDLAEVFANPRRMRTTFDKLRNTAINGHKSGIETTVIMQDVVRSLKITAYPIPDLPNTIQWQFEDLTTETTTRALLKREQEKLTDFTDNAPVGFFSVDETGNFTFANKILEQWLGLEDDRTLIGKPLHEFLFDQPENVDPFEVFENADDLQIGEISLQGADDRVFKAAITHSILREEKGKVRTRSVVYDLSADHGTETALQHSQDSFARLFEEAPVGICLIARDRSIDAANLSFGKAFGQKSQDITYKNFDSYVDDEDMARVKDWIETLFSSKLQSATIEAKLKTTPATTVQIYGRKFRGGDSMVLHFIDLTEQKNLEEQFTQSQKMQAVGQLAGGIAHDFNNLLTAMIGFCDLLLLRHKPGDPSYSDLNQIQQNANRAANLVRQLLAFSRQQTLQPKVLEVRDVLAELSHLIRRLIGARITLDMEHFSRSATHVKVDQGQLEQVLVNLAVNARDAMPDGGALSLKSSIFKNTEDLDLSHTNDTLPPGQWVKIAVSDTGTGIPPDVITRIFEPFFTTKSLGNGTGLGLSTVHGIVLQTGGFLSVDTEMGVGTTFSIYLPFHTQSEDEKESENETEEKKEIDLSGTGKILLVEDEDAVRSFSARALSNKGYEIIEAINGRDALEKTADNPKLELIITDVVMPEMDGPTMIEELQKTYKDVKIIFMSGYTDDRLKQQFGDDIQFLPKPFTLKDLAQKVKDILS